MDTNDPAGTAIEADARVLENAAEVLRRRFGVLTAGDLINGLASCTGLLRSGTGIIKPAQAQEPRNGILVLPLDEQRDDEPGHGYHEQGDY